jgi:hypothetical protein
VCGVAALDAAARGRGQMCNAAPPLCVTAVLTSMLGVRCSGVRCVFGLCVCYSLIAVGGSLLVVSVRCCAAVLLCCCVAVLLCVALRCIGRSLRLSAAVVALKWWRCAGV